MATRRRNLLGDVADQVIPAGASGMAEAGGGLPMGAQPNAVGTDELSNEDLAQFVGAPDPEEAEAEQMIAALEDPSLPPEQRQLLEQQLALAARRRMAETGQ